MMAAAWQQGRWRKSDSLPNNTVDNDSDLAGAENAAFP
jgi:hypothetical protein